MSVAPGVVAEFHYRIPGRPVGLHPGAHPSRAEGMSGVYVGLRPLLARPDPRRIDLRRSATEPFGQWLVRTMSERVSVPVYVIADVSASMAFDLHDGKRRTLADLTQSAAWSAWRAGDPFGFIAADVRVRQELFRPAMFSRAAGPRLAETVHALPFAGASAKGLLEAARYLGKRRALILLASDFHFDLDLARQVLESLAGHFVVPVVIWERAETAQAAQSGWIEIADSETAEQRFLWLRPSLSERMEEALHQRRAALNALFRSRGLRPLFLDSGFRADAVTRYFLGHSGNVGQSE